MTGRIGDEGGELLIHIGETVMKPFDENYIQFFEEYLYLVALEQSHPLINRLVKTN